MRSVRALGLLASSALLATLPAPPAAAVVGLPCSYVRPAVVTAGPIQSDTIALATYVACWFQTGSEPYTGDIVAGPWENTVLGPFGVLPPTLVDVPDTPMYLCTHVEAINFAPYPTYVACAPVQH